jgi:Protein of unknown function (DUF2735)
VNIFKKHVAQTAGRVMFRGPRVLLEGAQGQRTLEMGTQGRRESAKIYQFPKKGRPQPSYGANADVWAQDLPVVDFGSGWYHEAAIREAEQPRKPWRN